MRRGLLPAALALLLAGCTSIRVSHNGCAMVEIENTGWSILHFIPLASGDPRYPDEPMCSTWFRNTVTLENNMRLLDVAAERENALSVRDLVSYTTDENVFLILLRRRTFHTSAQLLTRADPEPAAATEP